MRLKTVLTIIFMLINLLIEGCQEERPAATIIIIAPNTLVPESPPTEDNETPIPAIETPIPELKVVAGKLAFSSCSCKGIPIDVKIELVAEGGIPPYTLEGFNKEFNNSYVVPIDDDIDRIQIKVSSSDGQEFDIAVEIPPCDPPETCKSNGEQETKRKSPTDPPVTDPPVIDPPVTDPPTDPPTPCPTKPGKPGRPDCPKK